ncbi:MAG: hypothetical protein IJU19_06695 [Bacteroidales bacterium]|nr:hypothetical protein [Bacteroidales bacterium]
MKKTMMKKTIAATLLLCLSIAAQAQMVGATNNQHTERPTNPLHIPTGPYLRLTGGYPLIGGLSFGYQFTPLLMAGIGVGYGYTASDTETRNSYEASGSSPSGLYWVYDHIYTWDYVDAAFPLYVEMELRTPKLEWSLFLNLKIGYCIGLPDDTYPSYPSYGPWNEWANAFTYGTEYYPFYYSVMAGAGWRYWQLGVGYSNSEGWAVSLAYSLPLRGIFF